MRIFNAVLTAVVVIPFSLMVLFYFYSILRRTLRSHKEVESWRGHMYYLVILLAQIAGLVVLGFALYVALYAGL